MNSFVYDRTKHFKVFFIVTTVCTVIWTIIAVELTLSFNSISDVYTIESTGQLIPFVIGIVGLGKTLNSITIDAIKKVSRSEGIQIPSEEV